MKYEGKYALYTDAGLVAFGISKARAMAMAKRIKWGTVTIATTGGTPVKVFEKARKKNPSRIGKRVMVARRKKAAADRRVASALATYLKRVNPGAKLAGAKVQKLAGGVIKITPVKLNQGRR